MVKQSYKPISKPGAKLPTPTKQPAPTPTAGAPSNKVGLPTRKPAPKD